ncbi:MAG: DNA translocase FtsK [Caldithrix sp.]|nr:DNA translocase FtsK [Caldithrix sp.]
MAKRKPKKKNTPRKQAWGIFVLGISLLLFLAIATFNVNDPVSLNVEDNPINVSNWLGPLGANIAYFLMQYTLGYPNIVLPVILFLYAIMAIRNRPFSNLTRLTGMMILWAILISVYLALPEALRARGQIQEFYPSGLIGGWLAGKSVLYLDKIGTIIVLIILTTVLLVFTARLQVGQLFEWITVIVNQTIAGFRYIGRQIKVLVTGLYEKWYERQKRKAQARRDKIQKKPPTQPAADIPEISIEEQEEDTQKSVTKEDVSETASQKDAFETDKDSHAQPIQTTLDDILERLDSAQGKVDSAAKPEYPEEMSEDANRHQSNENLDFEVQEETKEVELDYDQLVKESLAKYEFPSIDFLKNPPETDTRVSRDELRSNAGLLELKLADFGVKAQVIRVTAGPVITLYELQPAPGVKVSAIVNLANDLALAMEARGIRIIAPIPGKAAVGIEIPNRHPQIVYLKSLIRSEQFNKSSFNLPLALGKTINGESYIADLTKMPHLLIAGATGSGKSVGINTIITSLIYSVDPGKVKFILIDPKKLELTPYQSLDDHYLIWRPDLDEKVLTKPNNAVSMLNSMVMEMEKRYDLLANAHCRGIVEYNDKIANGHLRNRDEKLQTLPYIIVLIDELADLMMAAAKEVETPIARLAQMARAVGVHLIVATQRPSVDVITGMIKANFPARIAYQVATKVDSRTVLDMNGAEQLLGNGDMLFLPPGSAKPIRLQNPFISTNELENVIEHVSRQPKLPSYSIPQPSSSGDGGRGVSAEGDRDKLYKDAMATVVQHQQGSISLLQRRLKIGYSRAARIMDELEEDGIVGPADGSKAREVLVTLEELSGML